jgi:hypothetical protein
MKARLSFTARGRLTLWAVLALVVVGVAAVAVVAAAAQDRPFKAIWIAISANSSKQGAWDYNSGQGTASVVGAFTIEGWSHLMGKRNKCEGYETLTDAKGDKLYGTFEQAWDEATHAFVGPYTITGGTGRYAGATGTGTKTSTIPVPWDGTVPVTWDGTINF